MKQVYVPILHIALHTGNKRCRHARHQLYRGHMKKETFLRDVGKDQAVFDNIHTAALTVAYGCLRV